MGDRCFGRVWHVGCSVTRSRDERGKYLCPSIRQPIRGSIPSSAPAGGLIHASGILNGKGVGGETWGPGEAGALGRPSGFPGVKGSENLQGPRSGRVGRAGRGRAYRRRGRSPLWGRWSRSTPPTPERAGAWRGRGRGGEARLPLALRRRPAPRFGYKAAALPTSSRHARITSLRSAPPTSRTTPRPPWPPSSSW